MITYNPDREGKTSVKTLDALFGIRPRMISIKTELGSKECTSALLNEHNSF